MSESTYQRESAKLYSNNDIGSVTERAKNKKEKTLLNDKRRVLNSNGQFQPAVKEICARESVLTMLWKGPTFPIVYRLLQLVTIGIVLEWIVAEIAVAKIRHDNQCDLQTALADVVRWHGLQLHEWLIGGQVTAAVWLAMMTSTLIIPPIGLAIWSAARRILPVDLLAIVLFLVYQIAFIVIPAKIVLYYDLAPANGFIVMLEQSRLLMKSCAFVRETAARLIDKKDARLRMGNLRQYNYFLWAPTLIYREVYPHTKKIRWLYVVQYAAGFLSCLVIGYCLVTRWLITPIRAEYDATGLAQIWLLVRVILPGALMVMLAFYSFLHCWLNMFAELTRFADRLFYKAWWNAENYRDAMRQWNVIVHDWLYTYIYSDVQRLCARYLGQKRPYLVPMLAVMMISGFFHDFIFAIVLGYCYPVTFLFLYVIGSIAAPYRKQNFVVKITLFVFIFIAGGATMLAYAGEWFARQKCLAIYSDWRDFWIPFSWFCRVDTATNVSRLATRNDVNAIKI